MNDFNFFLPTKLYFGKDKDEHTLSHILKEEGIKRIALVIGQGSVRKNGLLDKVLFTLKENDIDYLLLEGVRPNPTKEMGDLFISKIKEYKPEYIIAIGGGSVIDTAKYMAVGYYDEGEAFDFNMHLRTPSKALPIGVILTISASGSEMSNSCVIQDDKRNLKKGFNSEIIRPRFAIENPIYTYEVNKFQTACGITDILMHTLERYFQASSSDYLLSDNFALGLLKTVKEAGLKAISNPYDFEARANLMLASSYSHNGLTHMGKKFLMPVHQLEHALSGCYPNIAHGEGLAILFPAWCEYFFFEHLDKLDRLGREVFNLQYEDKKENAEACILALKDYFKALGLSVNLAKDIDTKKLSEVFSNNGQYVVNDNNRIIDKEVAQKIYDMCKE